ncbi:MAG: phosphoglycerol geranylgeranyltransferase [Candidatus Hermodarchaeia archaeon]|jgi:phosphoglycerol geranylgeranyltransferase
MNRIEQLLLTKISQLGCIHIPLIDPEDTTPSTAAALTRQLEEYGSTAVMIGGSTVASTSQVDEVVTAIKNHVKMPVILFPNNVSGISKYADGVWFMSLLNSINPLFITGLQALAAPIIRRLALEAISLGYIIIGRESTASYIGQARVIPYDAVELAVSYALAAEYLGMHFVYLEAGSGAMHPILPRMITAVKETVSIPVIVGGGINTAKNAYDTMKAGADVIVTGTILEDNHSLNKVKEIIETIKR